MALPALKDRTLLRSECYIGGEWQGADDHGVIEVYNPANGTFVGSVPNVGKAETLRALDAAEKALPAWKALPGKARAAILRRWFDLLMAHHEDLAIIMTVEQGKPIAEARNEITYAASYLEWFGEEAKRVYGETIPAPTPDKRLVVLKQPIGVCAAITPWNFPSAMITRKAGPALAAGCTMVIKPASETPLSALALCVLAERAGVPKGVLSCVTGSPQEIGLELTTNPIVRKLSFTGSTAVGKMLIAQCASTVKRITMELGGNAPFIVFDDADVEAAVSGALTSKYRNAGQTCVCSNRLLVQSGIHDAFVERLAQAVSRLSVGDGFSAGVQIGPLIDQKAVNKVEALVSDAVIRGARTLIGGRRHALGGTFYEPTVIVDVPPHADIFREEIFGPVAPVFKFKTEEEAIRLANDSRFGLAAYFYGRDFSRVWRVAEGLEYGMVGINDGLISTEVAPFGGIKESGNGREGSKHGIEDYLEIKYICMGV